MNTTAQITSPRTPIRAEQPTDPRRTVRAPASERRAFGEMLAEIVPLIEALPFYGPPVVFVLGPWLFLVLMLAPPFACLFALVVVMIVAATVLAAATAAIRAIVVAPRLLVRHLRAGHAPISTPAAPAVAIGSPRVAA